MKKYLDEAKTLDEAKEKALKLLLQLVPKGKDFKTIEGGRRNKDGVLFALTLSLNLTEKDYTPEEARLALPTVFIYTQMDKEENYSLYFMEDYSKLPFFAKQMADIGILAGVIQPLPRPDESISVDEVHTLEGRDKLDTYFSQGEKLIEGERDGKLFLNAPKELKLFALGISYEYKTPEDVRDAVKAGEKLEIIQDGEAILSAYTGKTYKTSKEYLAGLAKICEAKDVKKYEAEIVDGYNFYNGYFYLKYLEYLLRQTEDYSLLVKEDKRIAKEYGFQLESIARYIPEGSTATEVALAHYLERYILFRTCYDGLPLSRVADFLRVPKETFTKLATNDDLIYALL